MFFYRKMRKAAINCLMRWKNQALGAIRKHNLEAVFSKSQYPSMRFPILIEGVLDEIERNQYGWFLHLHIGIGIGENIGYPIYRNSAYYNREKIKIKTIELKGL